MVKPFLIGTQNASPHLHEGIEVLRKGGSIMDAVETAVNGIEESPLSGNVGVGGAPTILGDVELDASIMDGATRRTGAVASVSKYVHVISIARKVMEETPHVLLVGDGAHRFARAMGFKEWDLTTERTRMIAKAIAEDIAEDLPDDFRGKDYYVQAIKSQKLHEWYKRLSNEQYGTTNVIGMDSDGNIVVGVSTSGMSWKYPGRVGDSPIIGAGNYCDNRYGGVACTGKGELSIRLLTARMTVKYLEEGMSLEEAVTKSFREIFPLNDPGSMQCIAIDKDGNTISASTVRESTHWYMDVDMDEPVERPGIWVKAE
ncbi:MAG TPA: isoaspartyl peptidase/L-asparaginase [Patescibacteria group bacterium]|nr:isoaspartyl peptidase/L-asparaginase [Patescibacteria group bacterium]